MKALMWIVGACVVLFLMSACAAGVHVFQGWASTAITRVMEGPSCSKP
jgi:hypothetical protein